VRGTRNADQTFWAKPADTEAGWMDDLSSEPVDAAEGHALDELAAGRHAPTDRVFHELRDIAPSPGELTRVEPAPVAPVDEDPPSAPAASVDGFDFDAVTDDLLPSWSLDLG
jgi:hypothetical protein